MAPLKHDVVVVFVILAVIVEVLIIGQRSLAKCFEKILTPDTVPVTVEVVV